MDFYSSTDAKREFGEILVKSQREPIGINRNGKPIAVIMSEKDYLEMKSLAEQATNDSTLKAEGDSEKAQRGLGLDGGK